MALWPSEYTQQNKILRITLLLCVNDTGELEGKVNQTGIIKNGDIVSQDVTSENEVSIDVTDQDDNIVTLILKLLNGRRLLVRFEDDTELTARKTSFNKMCKIPLTPNSKSK